MRIILKKIIIILLIILIYLCSVLTMFEATFRLTVCCCRGRPSLFGICDIKYTLLQTLRLCTGRTAYRGSRGIALLFHDKRH